MPARRCPARLRFTPSSGSAGGSGTGGASDAGTASALAADEAGAGWQLDDGAIFGTIVPASVPEPFGLLDRRLWHRTVEV